MRMNTNTYTHTCTRTHTHTFQTHRRQRWLPTTMTTHVHTHSSFVALSYLRLLEVVNYLLVHVSWFPCSSLFQLLFVNLGFCMCHIYWSEIRATFCFILWEESSLTILCHLRSWSLCAALCASIARKLYVLCVLFFAVALRGALFALCGIFAR